MNRLHLEFEHKISDSKEPISSSGSDASRSIWYIFVLALAPLYLLIIIGVLIFALIMLDRLLIPLTNFVLQQVIFIAILIIGMAGAIIAYSLSVTLAQRKIEMWRQNGQRRQAKIAQLVLVIVASSMILPIILALNIR